MQAICDLALNNSDYSVRKEALVILYNLCENHSNKYLGRVMHYSPQQAFFNVLSRYDLCEPYLIKIAISFCSIICVQCGPDAI